MSSLGADTTPSTGFDAYVNDGYSSFGGGTVSNIATNVTKQPPPLGYVIEYKPNALVRRFAEMTRFRRGSDVTVMFSPHKEGRDDYLWGLAFVGILLMCIYVVWTAGLYFFKRQGKTRESYWIGGVAFSVKVPSKSLDHSLGVYQCTVTGQRKNEYADTPLPAAYMRLVQQEQIVRNKVKQFRIIFFVAGLVYLTSSILFVTHGVTDLQNSVDTLYGAARDANTLSSEAIEALHFGLRSMDNLAVRVRNMLSDALLSGQGDTTVVNNAISDNTDADVNVINNNDNNNAAYGSSNIIAFLAGPVSSSATKTTTTSSSTTTTTTTAVTSMFTEPFCPNDPNLQASDLSRQVKIEIDNALSVLETQVYIFPPPLLNDAQASIRSIYRAAVVVENNTENVDFTDWRAMLLLVFYVCIPAYVMAVCVFLYIDADFSFYGGIVSCVLFPIMFLLTFAAWVCASLVIVALAVNADFCWPNGKGSTPDETIYKIAHSWGYNSTDYQYQVLDYYISQCTITADPLSNLRTYQPGLETAREALDTLYNTLTTNGNLEKLSMFCGRELDTIMALMGQMHELLETMTSSMSDIFDTTSCERLVPLYTTTVYEGVCRYGPSSIVWIFCCSLLIGISGMVMATFRVAYKVIFEEPVNALPKDDESHLENESILKDPLDKEKAHLLVSSNSKKLNDSDDDDDDDEEEYPGDEMEVLPSSGRISENEHDNTISSFYDDSSSKPSLKSNSSRLKNNNKGSEWDV